MPQCGPDPRCATSYGGGPRSLPDPHGLEPDCDNPGGELQYSSRSAQLVCLCTPHTDANRAQIMPFRLIDRLRGNHCYLHAFLQAWLWCRNAFQDPTLCVGTRARTCIRMLFERASPLCVLSTLPGSKPREAGAILRLSMTWLNLCTFWRLPCLLNTATSHGLLDFKPLRELHPRLLSLELRSEPQSMYDVQGLINHWSTQAVTYGLFAEPGLMPAD